MDKTLKNNIILIGFMGCGKTSVGKCLAEKNAYDLKDTDNLIELIEKDTISSIFKQNGEAYFRDLETSLLLDLSNSLNHTVLSTGGGMPMREQNCRLLRELGYVVYLQTSKETIINRLKNDRTRPLLQGEDFMEKAEQLLKFRDPVYKRIAHKSIITDNKSLDEIAGLIMKAYREQACDMD
jgi:shikimate kinase